MNFDDYQQQANTTAIYPNKGRNIVYPTLGLVGEAGEIAEKVKKIMRDDNDQITPDTRLALVKELGDVLWYIAALTTELGFDLSDVALANLRKLADRQERNRLHGSGDDR